MKVNNGMKQNNNISKYIVCTFTMLLTTVALMLIAPLFIMYEYIGGEKMWLIVATIHTVAAFTGVWISGIITKERSTMIPIVGTAIWMGVILCCGILLYDSKLTYALPCILGNIMGAYLGYFVVLHRKNGTMGRRKRRR